MDPEVANYALGKGERALSPSPILTLSKEPDYVSLLDAPPPDQSVPAGVVRMRVRKEPSTLIGSNGTGQVSPALTFFPAPTFSPTPAPEHQVRDNRTPAVTATPRPAVAVELPCPVEAPSPSLYCVKEVPLAVQHTLRGANEEALQTWQQNRVIEDFECVSVGWHPRRVFALDWREMSLAGAIPPQLSQLPLLQRLILRENQLHGSIPPELGPLPQLALLNMEWNFLTGGIPAELGQLTQLQRF